MASTTAKTRAQAPVFDRETPQVTTAAPSRLRMPVHLNLFRILVYVLLTLGAVLFVMPFLWMISTSLQTKGDIAQGRFIPTFQFISITHVDEE
ncbi:MAG: hypothetical protein GYB65_04700 [Chloroflexi bacterium]|nr:hypothetical protein [Chloroflexota bacterium]